MQSLKDKLLKAGLVSEEQAKKAEEQAKKPEPKAEAPRSREASSFAAPRPRAAPPRGRPPAAPTETRLPKFAPLPGSKEAQRNEAKKQMQLDRAIREKVLAKQVSIELGSTTF